MQEVDYNPIVEYVDYLVTLEDIIKENRYQRVSYLEYDEKRKEFVRHVYVSRITKKKGFECMEVFREYENGEKLTKNFDYIIGSAYSGARFIWNDKIRMGYYCRDREEEFDSGEWANIKMLPYTKQLTTIESIVSHDLSLRYCRWNENVDALDYIRMYKKFPIIEMLMKLELYHLVFNEKCAKLMTENKTFCKWLYNNRKDIKNNLISFQSIKQAFKKGYDVATYNEDIIKKRNDARLLSDILGKDLYKLVKDIKDKDRIVTYAQKVGRHNYQDYLEACLYFKLDIHDTKVLFPNDFKYWHDYYINQMETSKNEEIDKNILNQATQYKFLLLDLETLDLMFPTKTQDFIDEGEALHHCVGRMSYNKKMANGETLIIFVRRKEELNKPYVTMEYDPTTKKIRQLYADHDHEPSEEVKNAIYNEWLPMVQKIKKGKEKHGIQN